VRGYAKEVKTVVALSLPRLSLTEQSVAPGGGVKSTVPDVEELALADESTGRGD